MDVENEKLEREAHIAAMSRSHRYRGNTAVDRVVADLERQGSSVSRLDGDGWKMDIHGWLIEKTAAGCAADHPVAAVHFAIWTISQTRMRKAPGVNRGPCLAKYKAV